MSWLDYPFGNPEAEPLPLKQWQSAPGSLRLALRILPRAMAERMGLDTFAFGIAVPDPEGELAGTANVFYHRAQELVAFRARGGEVTLGQKLAHRMAPLAMILGHLMAHEVGHLLLGGNSHSRRGIMSVPWGRLSLARAAWGELLFTSQEAKRIRAHVQERTRAH
jgi:hypothetical protein